MKVQGTYPFKASIDAVWDSLLDPEVIAGCIPGCQKLELQEDGRYEAMLKVGLSAIMGTFQVSIELTDRNPPHSYKMLVEGRGTPGSIKGEGTLRLSEKDGATEVSIDGDIQFTGVLARVGQRMLGGTSKLMMDQFFKCMNRKATARKKG